MKKMPHIGCGSLNIKQTTGRFENAGWQEIRIDADLSVSPDMTGSFAHLNGIESASIDAIFFRMLSTSFYIDTPVALAGARRVLKPKAFMVNPSFNLEFSCKKIAEGRVDEAIYMAESVEVAVCDIIFSHRAIVGRNEFQVHRCSFRAERYRAGALIMPMLASPMPRCGLRRQAGMRAPNFLSSIKEHLGCLRSYGE